MLCLPKVGTPLRLYALSGNLKSPDTGNMPALMPG